MVTKMRSVLVALLLCAAAIQSVSAQDEWRLPRRYRGDGVHVRIARDYYLPADQVVTRPVVIVAGSATIDGTIEADFVVIGGSVRVGPTAHIRGDLTTVGGEVQLADGADITGQIHDVSVIWPELRFVFRDWVWGVDRGWWALVSLLGNIFRLTLVMVAACFLALVAPGWIGRIERNAADATAASGFMGLAAQIMFVPVLILTIVAMVVTIIGIPLLVLVPFAVLAFAIMWLAGFAGVAAQIGGRLRGTGRGASASPVIDTALGVFVLGTLTVLGNALAVGPSFFAPAAAAFGGAGIIIEYLAWTIGLGAALISPFRHRWHTEPPPIPSPVNATLVA